MTGTLGVDHGGTGATTAASARTNLGTWSLISDSYNTIMPADGTTNGWYKFGTSNTNYGILPSASGGAGSGHNYIGTSGWYWKGAYIDQIYGDLTGNVTGNVSGSAGSVAWGNVTGKPNRAGSDSDGGPAQMVKGAYTLNGGQQNPNYFGTNKVGFLMMNTTVNSNNNYKDWLIMDCYNGNDVGGSVAIGVNRQVLGAYIMRSAAARSSWAESAELLGTHNYTSYCPTKTGSGASGTWGINITGSAGSVALSGVTGADDLKAIEALSGTSGFLKKTAANTWTLDTNTYLTSNTGVTSIEGKTGALTLEDLGIVYSTDTPSSPTEGMIWLKPI